MRRSILTLAALLLGCYISFCQVSTKDQKLFADKLLIRKYQNFGSNKHSSDFFQVPFGISNYIGVEAVSNKFLRDAYPNEPSAYLLFTTLGLDEVVFRKFILQIFLYGNNDKETTTSLLGALCGDALLATRIYQGYQKSNSTLIKQKMQSNPYQNDIKERDVTVEEGHFDIPIGNSPNQTLKDKNLKSITFSTKILQFKRNGKSELDTDTKWNIVITPRLIQLISTYGGKRITQDFDVIESKYDYVAGIWIFYTGTLPKAHSVLNNEPVLKNEFKLYWDKQTGYAVEMVYMDKSNEKLYFVNDLIVEKKL